VLACAVFNCACKMRWLSLCVIELHICQVKVKYLCYHFKYFFL
jgi:hypothetical protein